MTNPAEVQGAWRRGWTLDVHTTSSTFLGYDQNGREQYDTKRSPLGELVYQLKYRGQQTAAQVAAVMADFFDNEPNTLARIDVIVPMPPSTVRAVQPVAQIAEELGKRLGKPLVPDAIRKIRETPELKNIRDLEERRELLDLAFEVDRSTVNGKGILLIDDLYRSGATANAVTVALTGAGASRVYFLAATRTRSNA
ncbi:MAG: ComF family protein [Planctomycetota bacterium]|nr:ComF family protein [Planctomycetota bacterium]